MKKPRKSLSRKGSTPMLLTLGAVASVCLLVLGVMAYAQDPIKEISYTDFLKTSSSGLVKEVHVVGSQLTGVLDNGERFVSNVVNNQHLWDTLHASGVSISIAPPEDTSWFLYFVSLVLGLLLIAIIMFGMSYFKAMQEVGQGGGGKLFGMGKSKARFYSANEVGVKFTDVAGVIQAKEDLQDIIQFLKAPKKFSRIGARVPRGVLLSGDPGNGKTLLAKAVAGEANCPFFSMSGSDFVEVFVGVGASRVRDLFVQARKHGPCIVFIDEIDAVGRKRGVGSGGGHDEREQTLNQLLSEMDGFATNPGTVIVLAATNRVDVLDKALLRPGRFDRVVSVPYPDVAARQKILGVHVRSVKIDKSVSLDQVARGTSGFSGAQLANLVNEAALAATKANRKTVEVQDFEAARDKLIVGAANKSMIISDKDKKWTAYHEVGHAMLNLLLPETDPFHKVTIVPHGQALGISWSLPEGDKYSQTREQMVSRITVALGGMLAEEMKFNETTSGVASDLKAATKIARAMVTHYGMSSLGPVIFGDYESPDPAPATVAKIDSEIGTIIAECKKRGKDLLSENWTKVELLVEKLLEKETMHAVEVYELLSIEPREVHSFQPETLKESTSNEEASSGDDNDEGGTPKIASSD